MSSIFTLAQDIVILDDNIPPKAISEYFNMPIKSIYNRRQYLKKDAEQDSNRTGARYSDYEISIIKNADMSIKEKALLLDRTEGAIRTVLYRLAKKESATGTDEYTAKEEK